MGKEIHHRQQPSASSHEAWLRTNQGELKAGTPPIVENTEAKAFYKDLN